MSKAIIASLKWIGISILFLGFVLVSYSIYVVTSFDEETLPSNHGMLNLQLFPGNNENSPLIVGFGGGEGGNAWALRHWEVQRQRFLDNGFSFLAVGYFGMPGTPEKLDRISLSAIYRAIKEIQEHPFVSDKCIALVGGSKGAELALTLASFYSDIDTIVALAPSSAVFFATTEAMTTSSWSINDAPLPFVPLPFSATWEVLTGDIRGAFEVAMSDDRAMEEAAIQVENINGPILLISAKNDEMWPSNEMSKDIESRLQKNDYKYHFQHIEVNGGHQSVLKKFNEIEQFLETNFMQSRCDTES